MITRTGFDIDSHVMRGIAALKKWSFRESFRGPLRSCARLALTLGLGTGTVLVAIPVRAVEFPSTGDRGAPSRTAGGGTRGEWCEGTEWTPWSVSALVPDNNVSTFAKDQASLWLHVAEDFGGRTAEMYVQDAETREAVYQEKFLLDELSGDGLIKVDLPAAQSSGETLLEVGQDYYWEFSIICNEYDRTQDYVVQGLLHRVETEAGLVETLSEASPEEKLEGYANAKLWQETLEVALSLKAAQPALWQDLLTSVGLAELVATADMPAMELGVGPMVEY